MLGEPTLDVLYFAPGVRFDELDLSGAKLPEQVMRRVEGYYLRPAEQAATNGDAFAAGVVLVSCIDAIVRLRFNGLVGERFRKLVAELPDVGKRLSQRVYDNFRNGLVHEGGSSVETSLGSTTAIRSSLLEQFS